MNENMSYLPYIATLLGILILLGAVLYVRKLQITTGMLSRTALLTSMVIVLSQIHFFRMPQGGELNLGMMVPLIFLAVCYGGRITLMAGFVCGIVDMMLDPYFLHPIQILFDYPFPFMAMAVVALFKNHIIFGTLVAYVVNFLFHFISGVVFFGANAPEGVSVVYYSAVYNVSTVVPDFIICCLILYFLPIERIRRAIKKES